MTMNQQDPLRPTYGVHRGGSATFAIAMIVSVFSQTLMADSWQNPTNQFDVSGDGVIAPDDFLILLNELQYNPQIAATNGALPPVAAPPPFVDVLLDNHLTPHDLLLLVNHVELDETLLAGAPDSTTLEPSEAIIRLSVTDLSGTSIDQVAVGSVVLLNATIEDLAPKAIGAYAGYLDLGFDLSLVTISGPTEFDQENAANNPGTAGPGSLGGIGTVTPPSGGDNVERFLFSVPFTTENLGTVDFSGSNGVALVLGNNSWLSPTIEGATLTVVPEPTLCWLTLLFLGAIQFAAFRHR